MSPLEIEEETMSLFDETNGRAPNMRKRNRESLSSLDNLSDSSTGFRGLLRSETSYAIRNAFLLGTLAWMVFMFVDAMDKAVEDLPMVDENPRGVHQSSFGGAKNPASIEGQKAYHQDHEDEPFGLDLIPKSNVGQHVSSISLETATNHIGHYWHDPYVSVYSSPLYDGVSQDELEIAQEDFEERVNATKKQFGSWDLVDTYYENNDDTFRLRPDFDLCPNRDCNVTSFPESSWQNDEEYVGNFIDEAKKLIYRVKEGIYEEYGHSSFGKDGKKLPEEERELRSDIFQVIVTDTDDVNEHNVAVSKAKGIKLGVSHMTKNAWDGLVRKLLHSMMTNDAFFVVVAGDGAAAGHGNNFLQSPIMQFHYLMEPIMDLLAVRLVSRNMAMKAHSSVYEAMGGADLYGEVDLLWYDSHYAGDTAGVKDLLYKQTILGGERVPVILTNDPVNLQEDSSSTAWIGNLQPNDMICGTNSKGVCDMDSHNSVCWVPRIFITPNLDQHKSVDAGAFPGNRVHQLESRKLTMTFLHALDAALDLWVEGIEADGFPLAESYWHVGDVYDKIREAVRTSAVKDSACEVMMKDLATVCHVEMHGNTEWTPRVHPYENSLRALLPFSIEVSDYYIEGQYDEVDLMPKEWAIPKGQVDPHLIAISTSAPAPESEQDEAYLLDDDASDWVSYNDDLSFHSGTDTPPSDDGGDTRGLRHSMRRPIRQLQDTETIITAGTGWNMDGVPAGFCDGSAQSTCGRDQKSKCLMAGHNDHQAGILGDALSGWLLLTVRHVKEGIILVRFDTDVAANANAVTEGWTTVDNKNDDRKLNIPHDFAFDYSINGEIKSLSRSDFLEMGVEIADGMILHPLLIDADMGSERRQNADDGETIELAIRIRSKQGRAVTMAVTHVFYA